MQRLPQSILMIAFTTIFSINYIHAQESVNKKTKTPSSLLSPASLRVGDYTDKTLPNTPAAKLLAEWLKAHNKANFDTLSVFVKKCYSEKLLSKVDLQKHVDFYFEATKMFGKLRQKPYQIEKNKKLTIIAYFLKEGLALPEAADPENVVVVEIDADIDNPKFLRRGVGMAALICNLREESRN